MMQVLLSLVFLVALFGVAIFAVVLRSNMKGSGSRSGRSPQEGIEERVLEISGKIDQIRKLRSIAADQVQDGVMVDLIGKHESIVRYLMEYLDRYEAQLLRLRYEALLEACKHRDMIDEVIEAKEAITLEKRNIEASSQASTHEELERQYAEIVREIDEIVKLSLINSTRNILAQESPVQRNARLRSLDFSPREAAEGESDDIESLNQAYDTFIAETRL